MSPNTYMDQPGFWNNGYLRSQLLCSKWQFIFTHRKGDLEGGCGLRKIFAFASPQSAIPALAELITVRAMLAQSSES